jgi:hypothetical protein
MNKRRIRTWLFHFVQLFAPKPPEEPRPSPSPGEIMAVREVIPARSGDRTPAEAELYSLFRIGWRAGYEAGRKDIFTSTIHTQHSLPALPAVRSPLRDAPLHEMLAGIAPTPTIPKPRPFQTRVLTPLPPVEEEDGRIEFWEDRFLLDMTATTEKREAV